MPENDPAVPQEPQEPQGPLVEPEVVLHRNKVYGDSRARNGVRILIRRQDAALTVVPTVLGGALGLVMGAAAGAFLGLIGGPLGILVGTGVGGLAGLGLGSILATGLWLMAPRALRILISLAAALFAAHWLLLRIFHVDLWSGIVRRFVP